MSPPPSGPLLLEHKAHCRNAEDRFVPVKAMKRHCPIKQSSTPSLDPVTRFSASASDRWLFTGRIWPLLVAAMQTGGISRKLGTDLVVRFLRNFSVRIRGNFSGISDMGNINLRRELHRKLGTPSKQVTLSELNREMMYPP